MAKILSDIFPNGISLTDLPAKPPIQDHYTQLRVAIADAGLTPPDDLVFDGQIHRFSTNGKKKDSSGWYVAFDGKLPAGAFGDWRQGMEVTWRADIGRELTSIEQMQHASRMRELKAKRDKELAAMREDAAEKAIELWEGAPLASDEHPYLQRKGITNPGLRVAPDGRLMAPMFIGDDLVSIQHIAPDGTKRFLKGGKTAGAWWLIGNIGERVYLAEGVATAQSIFEATGRGVAIAYSAGNMPAVAKSLREAAGPAAEIVVVADNDESGTGERYGQEAAQACGGRLIVSPVGDANDYAQSGGDLAGLLEPVHAVATRYKLTPASQMTNLPPVRWQIKRILPAKDVVAIYGPPGAGKSFMALDMAAAISEGRDWMGYRTKPAHVVYLVLEAANGFSGRLKAWQMHHGRTLPDRFQVIAHEQFSFSKAADIAELVQSIQSAVPSDHGGLVVFIDTLARAMGTFEENDNNDMGQVINCADTISRHLDATVAMVAHPGKDSSKGLRGGSALLGGLDTVIQLEKDENGIRTWIIEKQKEGEDGLTGQFALKIIEIGQDEDGDPITSAVVVNHEDEDSSIEMVSETKELAKFRKYFEAAVLAVGRMDTQKNAPFLAADAWNEWSKTQQHESDGARKTYLSKAKKVLVSAGYIEEMRGGYIATGHEAMIGAFIGLPKF